MKFSLASAVFVGVLLYATGNFYYPEGLEDLIGTDIHKCVKCLCHARTGCWDRRNCAKYSISLVYWMQAGKPGLQPDLDSEQAYEWCMKDENCILNTIKRYTELFGNKDCNCDDVFDCKDRFAIHLFGRNCTNPNFGNVYARRFNVCSEEVGVSGMSSVEGDCDPEVFNFE